MLPDAPFNRSVVAGGEAVFAARMVFLITTTPTELKSPDPAPGELLEPKTELAATVLWLTMRLPESLTMPPPVPPLAARFPLTVLFSRITVPTRLAMPPPRPGLPPAPVDRLPLTVLLFKV